ncbi:hypothetical protein ACFOGJ_24425 [Marinibaculum pumilum]|uniref:Uncharacterized protein n=1 Tax=Marinibaculum pumilum TaxID=1766165 RepID=A0ABV7L830_9PROT
MTAAERRRILWPLVGFAVVLMMLPPLLLGGLTRVTRIEIGNDSQIRQASAVAGDLATELGRAAQAGIPLDRIPGLEKHLAELRAQYPSIRFFALISPKGEVMHFSGPQDSRKSLVGRLARLALGPGDDTADRPIERRTGGVAINRIAVETQDGDATLLFGVEPAIQAPTVTPEYFMLASMMAVLFLLGLPILYDLCRRFLFRPIRQLDFLFAEAAAGRFHTMPLREVHPELHGLLRLWNNEVLSLEERNAQFEAFAGEARAAADDPAVARAIERLQRPALRPFRVESGLDLADIRFGAEMRVPAMMLAFLAAVTFGNWPGAISGIVMVASLLAGGLGGYVLAQRHRMLVRGLLSGGCVAMAIVMLVSAVMPFLLQADDVPGAVWILPNALLLGFLLGATVRQPPSGEGGDGGPVGITGNTVSATWHEMPRLLVHVAAGICAAAIWSVSGPSMVADTLEAWIAAAALPMIAARLQSKP